MRVLIACECSGVVRDAFRRRGHEAFSNDVEGVEPEGEWPNYHLFGDALWFLDQGWDMLIAHPPCTYLSLSGLHWNKRRPGRAKLTEDALEFVRKLLDAPIAKIALENPIGCIGTRIRPATQIIQPYQFGEDASKATCLWLKGLPPLVPTKHVSPRMVNGRPRWANQTDSGQNKLGPSADRAKLRSITYAGIAKAMAEQWG